MQGQNLFVPAFLAKRTVNTETGKRKMYGGS